MGNNNNVHVKTHLLSYFLVGMKMYLAITVKPDVLLIGTL